MEFIIRYRSWHRPLRCSSVPRQRTDNFYPGPDSKRRTADLRRPPTLLGCSDLSQPPSTLISRRVMYDASWEARNATAPATRLGARTSRLLRSQITHQLCLAFAKLRHRACLCLRGSPLLPVPPARRCRSLSPLHPGFSGFDPQWRLAPSS
jgi:hypothetical protein